MLKGDHIYHSVGIITGRKSAKDAEEYCGTEMAVFVCTERFQGFEYEVEKSRRVGFFGETEGI